MRRGELAAARHSMRLPAGARELIDVALKHQQVRMIVSALARRRPISSRNSMLAGWLSDRCAESRNMRSITRALAVGCVGDRAGLPKPAATRHHLRGGAGAGGRYYRPRGRRASGWRHQPRATDRRGSRTWRTRRVVRHRKGSAPARSELTPLEKGILFRAEDRRRGAAEMDDWQKPMRMIRNKLSSLGKTRRAAPLRRRCRTCCTTWPRRGSRAPTRGDLLSIPAGRWSTP